MIKYSKLQRQKIQFLKEFFEVEPLFYCYFIAHFCMRWQKYFLNSTIDKILDLISKKRNILWLEFVFVPFKAIKVLFCHKNFQLSILKRPDLYILLFTSSITKTKISFQSKKLL